MESNHLESKEEKDTLTLNDLINHTNKEIIFYSKMEQKMELKQCSYEKGYLTQELWACLTCYKEKAELACICTACSIKCHQDHELVHLYFKRNFRCDCGNSKFITPCCLQNEKHYDNPFNKYNHNFTGKYCYCDQEENEEEDSPMIQCIMCEDWYHQKHLDILDNSDLDGDLICKKCLNDKLSFLRFFPKQEFVLLNQDKEEVDSKLVTPSKEEIITEISSLANSDRKRKFKQAFPNDNHNIKKLKGENDEANVEELQTSKSAEKNNNSELCKLNIYKEINSNQINSNDFISLDHDIFIKLQKLPELICHCSQCLKMYEDLDVEFLFQNFYEDWVNRELIEDKLNKEADEESPDNQNIINNVDNFNIFELSNIKNLTVEKQIEMSMVMKNFKDKFVEFMQNLPPGTKTITEEHMAKFLSKFKSENPFLKPTDSNDE